MHSAFILTELRYPAVPLAGQLDHKRFVHPGPLVLRAGPLKSPPPTTDRDRTVSRRSEPSSRTALIGEQPNPWELLHPQDAMSRHRGAKPERRCELLTPISLLSPAYLLSVERWPLPYRTTGSLKSTFVSARLVGLAVNLVYAFALVGLISKQPEPSFARLRYRLGGDRPSQTTRLPLSLSRITGVVIMVHKQRLL